MIPFFVPDMPSAAEIMPYLEAMDRSKWYSNFGPLEQSFRKKCAIQLSGTQQNLATFSNGTAALQAALAVLNLEKGRICLTPSWTFSATPAAIVQSGLIPHFVDVSLDNWALSPDHCRAIVEKINPAALIVVAPFGAPLPLAEWELFQAETGVKVIIDGAAGFNTMQCSALPTIISLHATKVFGVGEGGLLLANDTDFIARARQISNFGFNQSRQSQHIGGNAKMSEYHAAVGLANFDRWADVLAKYQYLAALYKDAFSDIPSVHFQKGFGEEWIGSTLTCRVEGVALRDLQASLTEHGIATRHVWAAGCHTQPAYKSYGTGTLCNTENLAQETISLPFHTSLIRQDIDRIAGAVKGVCHSTSLRAARS